MITKQADAADLTTVEGRIEWFCAQYEVTAPRLDYDERGPGGLLLTDDLMNWCKLEGVSLDWILAGGVSDMLRLFREKRKVPEDQREFFLLFQQLDKSDQDTLLGAITRGTKEGGNLRAELDHVDNTIRARRAGDARH